MRRGSAGSLRRSRVRRVEMASRGSLGGVGRVGLGEVGGALGEVGGGGGEGGRFCDMYCLMCCCNTIFLCEAFGAHCYCTFQAVPMRLTARGRLVVRRVLTVGATITVNKDMGLESVVVVITIHISCARS